MPGETTNGEHDGVKPPVYRCTSSPGKALDILAVKWVVNTETGLVQETHTV